MRKIFCILLVCILLLSACSGGESGKNYMVEEALKVMEKAWEDMYDESRIETDRYFEIKNTRVIKIKDNATEEFKDVAYVVEFVIFSDLFGSAPYYDLTTFMDAVLVYKDGRMEATKNPFAIYRSRHYSSEFTPFIESIEDLGGIYNCVKHLN